MRLIDADAYKKYLEDEWIPANFDAIDAQPTIEPKQGEWVYEFTKVENPSTDKWVIQRGKLYCSECKEETYRMSNFCPDCGADMRKEK